MAHLPILIPTQSPLSLAEWREAERLLHDRNNDTRLRVLLVKLKGG
jgi:hypothetical protein